MKLFARLTVVGLVLLVLPILAFVINVALGMRTHAQYSGTISGLRLHDPLMVLRDDRGVPHIIARNDRDMFFAQGYVEGSDRLFQLDYLRRSTLGELAEVFGRGALASDEEARMTPVRAIVEGQWRQLDPSSREIFTSFSDGVNAAMQREPLPVEFRMLAYRPRPWTPQDSLVVAMATVLYLIDDWNEIAPRDAAYRRGGSKEFDAQFPLTDPCYDAPVLAGLSAIAPGPRCRRDDKLIAELGNIHSSIGSNEWAVGADHSVTGRALLANDPHLPLGIPGVWYLLDLHSPHYHVAGASLPGLPGIVLGHNDHIAWGATAGSVTTLSVFLPPAHLSPTGWHTEEFGVRFGPNASAKYYRTPRVFGVTTQDHRFVLVRWSGYDQPASFATSFLALDRAASIEAATAALASFPGPSLNFELADTKRAAYVLAGQIPNDPVRARWFHPATDLAQSYSMIPFASLPKVAPSRSAIVWTANNKMYGAGYAFALSPQFAPPYRAYRIAQLLRARRKYDMAYFEHMQMDVLSLPERELARDLAPLLRRRDPSVADAFAAWNGNVDGDSTTATAVIGLRHDLAYGMAARRGRIPTLLTTAKSMRALPAWIVLSKPEPWSIAGAVPVTHPLPNRGLDGIMLPGNGDAFTLHAQFPVPTYSQSFRAVWDVGNWDAGGISLPQGESGERGSGHYTDEAQAFIAGHLWPLPFSDAAVQRAAVTRETLLP